MGTRYEGRIDIERDAIVLTGTDSEQLDGIAHLTRILYVLLGDLLDAFDEYVIKSDIRTEADGGEDRELSGCVVAADVIGRVGLCKALLLRHAKSIRVADAFFVHTGKNEIRRPVHDAYDAFDLIRRQGIVQRTKDRDTATDTGFAGEIHMILHRGMHDLRSKERHDILIGTDDAHFVIECLKDILLGRMDASHDFDYDTDIGVGHDLFKRRCQMDTFQERYIFVLVRMTHQYIGDFQLTAQLFCHHLAVSFDGFSDAASDGAEAKECNIDCFHKISS